MARIEIQNSDGCTDIVHFDIVIDIGLTHDRHPWNQIRSLLAGLSNFTFPGDRYKLGTVGRGA